MDTLQDVQNSTPPDIDPQQYSPFQTTDLSYSSVISHSDGSISSTHTPHLSPPVPPIFPPDHPSSLSMPMQISQSQEVSPMDVLNAPLPERSFAPAGLLSDFSSQSAPPSAFQQQDPHMNGIESLDPSHQLLSSPSATSSSASASHASSPAMNGMVPAYAISTSSLATALDGPRSRSGSSASPGHLSKPSSDISFPSTNKVPPPPARDPAFSFHEPPPYSVAPTKESSPDDDDQQRQLLHNVLRQVAVAANTGSEAVSNGQTSETRSIVDNLKKTLTWVSEMLRDLSVNEQLAAPPSVNGSPHAIAAAVAAAVAAAGVGSNHSSPPVSTGMEGMENAPVGHINGLPGYAPPPSTTVEPSLLDATDMSRKRCASTVAGNRVVKAMKLEPQDDVSLQMLPIHPPPPPPHMNASPVFPYSPPASIAPTMSTIVEHPPIPPLPASLPVSRPPSSSGLSSHRAAAAAATAAALNLMADIQSSHPAISFPSTLDFNSQLSHTTSDFPALPPPAPALSSSGATATSVPPSLSAASFTATPAATAAPTVWPESRTMMPVARHGQHSHTLSGSGGGAVLPLLSTVNLPFSPSTGSFNSPTHSTHPATAAIPAVVPPATTIGRMSRSSSISHSNPFAFGVDVPVAAAAPPPIVTPHVAQVFEQPPGPVSAQSMQSRPSTSGLHTRPQSPEYGEEDEGEDSDDEYHMHAHGAFGITPPGANAEDGKGEAGVHPPFGRRGSRTSPSAEGSSHNNEVPQEYRADVERIFFEFLNKTCSNLEATDAKGEPIHQTLMAKKMQRLDESPDFRPFKFRIQAFTNAFLEELARQGFPEEKIPMKKIRNFLWNQPYISRFNEEGKKSKSKGNHIWHVDGKKSECGWMFRPFQRKLAGAPPGVAYIGLRWTWTPRVWDPQASRSNMPVKYSSPNMPLWLSWNGETLSGIPPPDAENCDVMVEAKFVQDGQEEMLSHTVHLTIAPMAAVDASFTPSRRPSLVGDLNNPRRIMSDSVLSQTTPARLRAQAALAPAAPPVVAPDSQVVQVLTSAAQRVAQEAQSQVVASPNELGPELHSLAKQQHVLTVTAQAFNNKTSAEPPDGSSAPSNALAAAAQQVVLQAARQVAADRTSAAVSCGVPPAQAVTTQVTVKEVSVATQSAVAQAVEMVGPLSSEVDVLMTAKSLLQQQTIQQQVRAPTAAAALAAAVAAAEPPIPVPLDPVRPHSTGTMLPLSFPPQASIVAAPPIPVFFPHAS